MSEQEQEIPWREMVAVLHRRRSLILQVFLGGLATVVVGAWLQGPTYRASATLMVASNRARVAFSPDESTRPVVSQLNEQDLAIDHIVVAGKGGTYAGLYLAAKAMNSDIDIAAVAISELLPNWRGDICDLIRDSAALLGVDLDVKPDELHVLTEYFGENTAPQPKR